MSAAIETRDLRYRYGEHEALRGVSLRVGRGEVYGFLGPNGAGKTTTIRLLLGLLWPAAGSVTLFGEPFPASRLSALARIGSLVEQPSLYPHLTGEENLEAARLAMGGPRSAVTRALELTGLGQAGARRVREYSLGMRQRLALSLALLRSPELVVLDEPANGLDPEGILWLRGFLRSLAAEGVTVFLSSHILAEVEQVADRVGILAAGCLRFEGALDDLRRLRPGRLRLRASPAEAALRLLDGGARLEDDGSLVLPGVAADAAAEVNARLVHAGLAVSHLAFEQGDLEEAFLHLVRGEQA